MDASSYVVVKVDMVHENLEDLKLEVPPDDTTLTIRDAVTKSVQWRSTSIDVDPSTIVSASATLSQLNAAPASIFPETRSSPSLIQEESRPSPIREEPRPSLIQEQLHHRSPPQTQSTLHLIRHGQRRRRMYVARVNRSSGRYHPRQQRAINN
jgi:hypothetical protein